MKQNKKDQQATTTVKRLGEKFIKATKLLIL